MRNRLSDEFAEKYKGTPNIRQMSGGWYADLGGNRPARRGGNSLVVCRCPDRFYGAELVQVERDSTLGP